jgi:hypothetical protein
MALRGILEDKTLKYVHGSAMDWFGVDLTNEQIIEIGQSDRDLWHDLIDNCFDTVARDNFADAMTRYVLGSGQRWPRNGNGSVVFQKFMDEFERGCRSKGIKFFPQR